MLFKVEKCKFHVLSVSFLGDPVKVLAVLDWPQPDSRRQLQRFLGFANFYRRFICNYSSVVVTLTELTSSKRAFTWPQEANITINKHAY